MPPSRNEIKFPAPPLLNIPRELLLQVVGDLDGISLKNLIEAYPHDLALPLLPVLEAVVKRNRYSKIIILWAAKSGYADLVAILVDNGADINECNRQGHAAIHFAAWKGRHNVVKVLLEKGKNLGIKVNYVKGFTSYSPLHLAAKIGHIGIMELLIKKGGADVNARTNYFGRTPLHYAAHGGYATAVKMLMSHGAKIHARTFDTGDMPLHLAARTKRPDAIAILLLNGAVIDIQATDGTTPIHQVVRFNVNIVDSGLVNDSIISLRYLLEYKGSMDIVDNEGDTVMHHAITGHPHVVEILLNEGASLDVENNAGFTAYELAMRSKNVGMKELVHSEKYGTPQLPECYK